MVSTAERSDFSTKVEQTPKGKHCKKQNHVWQDISLHPAVFTRYTRFNQLDQLNLI